MLATNRHARSDAVALKIKAPATGVCPPAGDVSGVTREWVQASILISPCQFLDTTCDLISDLADTYQLHRDLP